MTLDPKTIELASALTRGGDRSAGARALAAHLGAEEIVVLVEDPDVAAFVPAPGFPQTLPGGAAWRALLRTCRTPGIHRAEVASRSGGSMTPAIANAREGLVFVLLGGRCDENTFDTIAVLLPFLAAMLGAEHRTRIAVGGLHIARAASSEAAALNAALETVRIDLQQQTRKLGEARARTDDAMRAKDDFLAMLGHELRNPLSPIVTALQILRLKGQTTREHDVIERQVAHLTRLVDDLLDVSRITRGKISLRRERIEVAKVGARVIEMVSPILEQKRHRLEVDIPATGLLVHVDPGRLAQVFSNLLINAAKYSEPERTITFSAKREGARIRIAVGDQGIGIEPDMLGVIFDRFTQAPQGNDRAAGGLGLGLTIVRSLVALHDGSVTAYSEGLERGSEFVVDLPVASAMSIDSMLNLKRGTALHAVSNGARLLLVDDNTDAVEMLADALRRSGYAVRTAHDGPAALRIAGETSPEIGILDLGLPVMDGFELARRLRQQQGETMRLVALTGYGQDTDRARSEQAGFDAHLVKPVDLQRVLDVLAEITRSSRMA